MAMSSGCIPYLRSFPGSIKSIEVQDQQTGRPIDSAEVFFRIEKSSWMYQTNAHVGDPLEPHQFGSAVWPGEADTGEYLPVVKDETGTFRVQSTLRPAHVVCLAFGIHDDYMVCVEAWALKYRPVAVYYFGNESLAKNGIAGAASGESDAICSADGKLIFRLVPWKGGPSSRPSRP